MLPYWQINRYIYPFHFKLEKEIELFPFSIMKWLFFCAIFLFEKYLLPVKF